MIIHMLIHFSSEDSNLMMEEFDSVDEALERAARIDAGRHVYLSQPDEHASNGMLVTRVVRNEDHAVQTHPTSPQVTDHNVMAERLVARFVTRGVAMKKTTQVED